MQPTCCRTPLQAAAGAELKAAAAKAPVPGSGRPRFMTPAEVRRSQLKWPEMSGLRHRRPLTCSSSHACHPGRASLASLDRKGLLPRTQVREVLRRMWLRHGELLSLVFAVDAAHTAGLPRAAAAGSSAHHMFFLQTAAVPPNKFRPISKMGEGV